MPGESHAKSCYAFGVPYLQWPAGNQRLDSSDNVEVRVDLGVFTSANLAAKLVNISQWLCGI
jgi:hypothetical protein